MSTIKCLRHVSCLDYDLQSLLETLIKHWTNVGTNYIFSQEEDRMLKECFWGEEPAGEIKFVKEHEILKNLAQWADEAKISLQQPHKWTP